MTLCRVRLGDGEQKRLTTTLCLNAGMSKKVRLGVVEFWDNNTLDNVPELVCSIIALDVNTFAFRYNPKYWNGL